MVIGIRVYIPQGHPKVSGSDQQESFCSSCKSKESQKLRTQAARTRAIQPEPQILEKGEKMKAVIKLSVVLLLAAVLQAQTATPKKKVSKPKPVNADVQALKDAVAAQQQQIQTLSQQLQQTNQQLQVTNQQFQQTQTQLQQAQQAAADAQQKANAVAESSAPNDSVDKLNSEYADVRTTLTNNALTQQEQQKRFSGLEDTLGRFRLNGDVRVRGESYFQKYSGCTACNDRNRSRVRIRFGFDGKLNDDFIAGVSLATGTLADPTTTNETLTNFFERKTIALDRGYITYNPVAHKWLSLTGGKFAYTWQRTSVTFDPDLNPEGFVAKVSKDFESVPVVKNVNLQIMNLLYNEASGASGLFKGRDSYAIGGQVGGRLQLAKFWTLTPSFTILNFRYPDVLLNANAFQVGATTSGVIIPPNTTPTTFPVTSEGPGCSTPKSSGLTNIPPCAFGPNGMTNATYTDASNNLHFLSRLLYADLILNNQFKTRWARLPINLLVEYENNLNAASHPFDYTYTNTSTVFNDQFSNQAAAQAAASVDLGTQSHAYLAAISIGQQKQQNDIQIGYAWLRDDQDAAISSWGESDHRAPTNILQHRFYGLWRGVPSTPAAL